MADDIQQKISEALDKGIPMSDIAEHLASHPNPDYQSYGKSWLESATSEPTRKSDFQGRPTGQGIQTGLIDWAQANPQDALLYGAGAYAALQAPKIASKVADYRLKQRELGLKERSLAAYESQVAKQGVAPESLNPQDDLIHTVRQNEFEQQKANTPSVQDQIAQERLKQAQLKTQRAELEHQNWVAKNTLSEAKKAFGRKAKDPAELRLMQTAVQQQAGKGPVAPTTAGAAPVAELPVVTSPLADVPPAERWGAPVNASVAPAAPAIVQPANVVSTGSTPEAAAAPIEKAEEIKAATKPKKVKTPISPEDATLTKQELGMKKHLLEMYGAKDYPTSAAQAYEKVKDILGYTPAYPVGEGGSLNPEEKGKILGYRKENIAGPKVNLTKDMKTILRKGGPAVAALVATTEFANAKTAEQKANAGANLIGAILPPGADIFEAGAPTVGQQAISNAYLLGSPYAQTEEAKLARLREKAGAGRGIAPPSAYMR